MVQYMRFLIAHAVFAWKGESESGLDQRHTDRERVNMGKRDAADANRAGAGMRDTVE